MSVKVRKYKRKGWEVDIRGELPDGRAYRKRWKSPLPSKSGSQRWGEDRERELFAELSKPQEQRPERKEVPTLEQFAPRFLETTPGPTVRSRARSQRRSPSSASIWYRSWVGRSSTESPTRTCKRSRATCVTRLHQRPTQCSRLSVWC